MGRRAGREIDESQGRPGVRGVATAGFVTGLIGTIWSGFRGTAGDRGLRLGSALSSSFEDCTTITTSDGGTATTC